jgi:hypothetical protein
MAPGAMAIGAAGASSAAIMDCPIERLGWMIRHVFGFGLPSFWQLFSMPVAKEC